MKHYRISYVHYHLRPGGVTRILQHTLRALGDRVDALILVAPDANNQAFDTDNATVVTIPELAYETASLSFDPRLLYDRLLQTVQAHWSDHPDVWHIHNHSLGKNAALSLCVRWLADRGERLLLHVHDFAEDRRPNNYRFLSDRFREMSGQPVPEVLYPIAEHVHYGVLNGRDRRFLQKAGLPTGQLHTLANPVSVQGNHAAPRSGSSGLYLYPTRAIRRKNLGEFLLWAAMDKEGSQYATTLAPLNPEARPVYDAWKAFAKDNRLPVEFEKGESWQGDFIELLQSAESMVTTSLAEGFGLAFLEPWLVGRPVRGRDLPEITRDFRERGINLDGLYDEVRVPGEWIDEESLSRRIEERYRQAMAAFGLSCKPADIRQAISAITLGERIAFSGLDESAQKEVIRRVCASAGARSEISPDRLCPEQPSADLITHNQETIRTRYNLEQYGHTVAGVYDKVLGSSTRPVEAIHPAALLSQFLDPNRFRLLLE